MSARSAFVRVSEDLAIHYHTAGTGSQVVLLVLGWTISNAVFEKNGMIELAGPERIGLDDLVRRYLAAKHHTRKVVTDIHALLRCRADRLLLGCEAAPWQILRAVCLCVIAGMAYSSQPVSEASHRC